MCASIDAEAGDIPHFEKKKKKTSSLARYHKQNAYVTPQLIRKDSSTSILLCARSS
jgi:hypothetical protein